MPNRSISTTCSENTKCPACRIVVEKSFKNNETKTTEIILDNSDMKQGNRLYGTEFMVESPRILKNKDNVAVILKTASYNKEIKEDILNNINDEVVFWE